ncbi:hypothetical protein C8Q78DRAFT_1076848 [Trametes maxima]|nr:hypothetical protein C8Q78DRAFT_1076848 [Trametes maxima]
MSNVPDEMPEEEIYIRNFGLKAGPGPIHIFEHARPHPLTMVSISVKYELNPPSDTPTPHKLSTTKTLQFSVAGVDEGTSQKIYYEGLRASVLQAKATLGEELTLWRDAVGRREDNKEAEIPKKSEDDVDEDEELDEQ